MPCNQYRQWLYRDNRALAILDAVKGRDSHEVFKNLLIDAQCLGNHRQLLAKQNRGVQFDRKHMTAPFECNILIHFVILCYYYISLQIEFQ